MTISYQEIFGNDFSSHALKICKLLKPHTQVTKIQKATLIIGTFSEERTLKCSGLGIKSCSVENMKHLFSNSFKLEGQLRTDHTTPFDTIQDFNFCILKKIK